MLAIQGLETEAAMIAKFKPFSMAETLDVLNTLDARKALQETVSRHRQQAAAGTELKFSPEEPKELAELYATARLDAPSFMDWAASAQGQPDVRWDALRQLLPATTLVTSGTDWTSLDYWKCKAVDLLCSLKKAPAPTVGQSDELPYLGLSNADRRLLDHITYTADELKEIGARASENLERGG